MDRVHIADEVWLAVPATRRGRDTDPRVRLLCRAIGFGLIAVNLRSSRVEMLAQPGPYRSRHDTRRRIRFSKHVSQLSRPTRMRPLATAKTGGPRTSSSRPPEPPASRYVGCPRVLWKEPACSTGHTRSVQITACFWASDRSRPIATCNDSARGGIKGLTGLGIGDTCVCFISGSLSGEQGPPAETGGRGVARGCAGFWG